MALRHLRAGAVTLVLIGGAPGTGKSSLADAAAGRFGFTVLNSDLIRKELAVASTAPNGPNEPTASYSAACPSCWLTASP